MSWFVYILEGIRTSHQNNNSKLFYVGSTNSIVRRWREHRSNVKSTFMTRYRIIPRRIAYLEIASSEIEACKREQQLKHKSHIEKQQLIQNFSYNCDPFAQAILNGVNKNISTPIGWSL